MKIRIRLLQRFWKLFLLFSICIIAVIVTYVFQIGEDNYFAGMQPWSMGVLGIFVLFVGILLLIMIFMWTRGFPSDFFLIFYSSIVVISFISLNSSSGTIDGLQLIFAMQLIFIPLLATWIAGQISFQFNLQLKYQGVLKPKIVDGIIFGIVFLVSAWAAMNPPASAGFDLISTLERRLEGRALYGGGGIMSYALAMTMNGLTPYISYNAGLSNRKILLLAALGFDTLFFWLLGVKAPFLYTLFAYFFGSLVAKNKHKIFVTYFLFAIIILFIINLLEWGIYQHSFVSDFIFRRLFAVQAQVQGYYIDFIMDSGTTSWNFLTGSTGAEFNPAFYIGEYYFGSADTNANTNAFLYAFSLNGVSGYLFAAFFVVVVLMVFDALYRASKNPAFLFLGFIYGLLLVEQAYSTAIVSSGVGMLFILILLEKYEIPGVPLPEIGSGNGREAVQ